MAVDYLTPSVDGSLWLLLRLLPGRCNSDIGGSLWLMMDYSKSVAATEWQESSGF